MDRLMELILSAHAQGFLINLDKYSDNDFVFFNLALNINYMILFDLIKIVEEDYEQEEAEKR